jgi:hypothetical protein
MFMVKLHKPYRGNVDVVMIRGDLILEVSTRRQTKKDEQYAAPDATPPEPGTVIGCWVLLDRLGWSPCLETPDEVALAMADGEALWRVRLEAVRAARDTPSLPQGREHEGPAI